MIIYCYMYIHITHREYLVVLPHGPCHLAAKHDSEIHKIIYEPHHEKTCFLHMRK